MMKNTFYLQRIIQKTTLLLSFLCLSVQTLQSLDDPLVSKIMSTNKTVTKEKESSDDEETTNNNTNNDNNEEGFEDNPFGDSDADSTEPPKNNKHREEFRELLNELGVNGEDNKKDDGVQVTEINLLNSHVLSKEDKGYSSAPNVSSNLSGTKPSNSGGFSFDFNKLKHVKLEHGSFSRRSVTMDSFGLHTNDDHYDTYEVSDTELGNFDNINIHSDDDFEQTPTVRLTFVNQGKLTGKQEESLTITKETTLGDLIKKYATFLRSKDENLKATVITSESSMASDEALNPENLKDYCLCFDDEVVPLRKLDKPLPRSLYHNKDVVDLIITKLTDLEKLGKKLDLTIQFEDDSNLNKKVKFGYSIAWSPYYFSYKVRRMNQLGNVKFFKENKPFKISNNSLLIDYESFRKGQPITAKGVVYERMPVSYFKKISFYKKVADLRVFLAEQEGVKLIFADQITEEKTAKYLLEQSDFKNIKGLGDYVLFLDDNKIDLQDDLDKKLIDTLELHMNGVVNEVILIKKADLENLNVKMPVNLFDEKSTSEQPCSLGWTAQKFLNNVVPKSTSEISFLSLDNVNILNAKNQEPIFKHEGQLLINYQNLRACGAIHIERKTIIEEDEAPKLSLCLLKGGHLFYVGDNSVEITKGTTIESFIKKHKDLLMEKGIDLNDEKNKGELDKGILENYALLLNETKVLLSDKTLNKDFVQNEIILTPGGSHQIMLIAKDNHSFKARELAVLDPDNIIDKDSGLVKDTGIAKDEIVVSYAPWFTPAYLMQQICKKNLDPNNYELVEPNEEPDFEDDKLFYNPYSLMGVIENNRVLKIVQKTPNTRNENVDNNEVKNNDGVNGEDLEEKNDNELPKLTLFYHQNTQERKLGKSVQVTKRTTIAYFVNQYESALIGLYKDLKDTELNALKNYCLVFRSMDSIPVPLKDDNLVKTFDSVGIQLSPGEESNILIIHKDDLKIKKALHQAKRQLQLYQENLSKIEKENCLVLVESNLQGMIVLKDSEEGLLNKKLRLQVTSGTTIKDLKDLLSKETLLLGDISSERHSLMINDTDLLEEEDDEQTLGDLGINPDEGICLALINKAKKDDKKITIYKTSIFSSSEIKLKSSEIKLKSSEIKLKNNSMRMDSTTEHEVYPWYSVRRLCKKLSLNPGKSKLTFKDKKEDLLASHLSTPLIDCGISKKNNELQYTLLDEPKEAPMSKPKSKETTVSVTLNLYQKENQIKTYQLNIPKDKKLYNFIDGLRLDPAVQWSLMLNGENLIESADRYKTPEQLKIKEGNELRLILSVKDYSHIDERHKQGILKVKNVKRKGPDYWINLDGKLKIENNLKRKQKKVEEDNVDIDNQINELQEKSLRVKEGVSKIEQSEIELNKSDLEIKKRIQEIERIKEESQKGLTEELRQEQERLRKEEEKKRKLQIEKEKKELLQKKEVKEVAAMLLGELRTLQGEFNDLLKGEKFKKTINELAPSIPDFKLHVEKLSLRINQLQHFINENKKDIIEEKKSIIENLININENKKNINKKQTSINKNEASINKNKRIIDTLNQNLIHTEDTVKAHTTQISNITRNLGSQTGRIDRVRGDLVAHAGSIDRVRRSLNTERGRIDVVERSLNTAQTNLGNNITNLRNHTNTQLNGKASSNSVTSLRTDVTGVSDKFTSLDDRVKDIEGDSNFMAYTGIALLSVTVSLILSKVLFDSKNPQEEDLPQKENQEEPSETTIEEDGDQLMQEEGEGEKVA